MDGKAGVVAGEREFAVLADVMERIDVMEAEARAPDISEDERRGLERGAKLAQDVVDAMEDLMRIRRG